MCHSDRTNEDGIDQESAERPPKRQRTLVGLTFRDDLYLWSDGWTTDFELATLDEQERQQSLELERHRPSTKEEVWGVLTGPQQAAMRHVDSVARGLHDAALPALQSRVLQLGFTHEDLDACLRYIRDEAPIVVHLDAKTLALLCTDLWYRSQFETGTSKGTQDLAKRQQWEDAMFAKAYAAASNDEHPKYGALNLTGDIMGVRGANKYGEFFITLAPAVRHRTSFANQDTGSQMGKGKMASNSWYAHVLSEFADNELARALDVSRSGRVHGAPSTDFAQYKECQMHGALSIASDVLVLSAPGHHAAASAELLQQVEAFRSISSCTVMWHADLLADTDYRGYSKLRTHTAIEPYGRSMPRSIGPS